MTRALTSIRALSQRAITTQSNVCSSSSASIAEQAAVQRAMAAAVAISRNVREVPAERKPSAAQFAAITHQELSQKVEQQLKSQMVTLEAAKAMAEGDGAMQAAADHLRGIPLRSKSEYKSMIAAYNARRA